MKIEVMQQVLDAEFNRGYKEGVRDAYARPAQRPWVGLTDEEMESLYKQATYMDDTDHIQMLMMAEAKLMEKNNAT